MKFKDKKINKFIKIKNYIFGTFLILISFATCISVFSYNENDPSFNNISTYKNIKNYLGTFGSYLADLVLQLIGLSSIILSILFIILGFKIIFNRTIYNKIQKILACIGVLASSSILLNDFVISQYCANDKCGGLLGSFFSNYVFYDTPEYSIAILFSLIFMISLSYLIDIRKNWWLVTFAKMYRLFKKILKFALNGIIFLFKLFTTKSFRISLIKFFTKNKGEYVFIDDERDEEDLNLGENLKHSELQYKNTQDIICNDDEDFDNLRNNKKDKTLFSLFGKKTEKEEKIEEQDENVNIKKEVEKNKLDIRKYVKYKLPNINLLSKNKNNNKISVSREELLEQSKQLIKVLRDFGVKGEMLNVRAGPIITLHEFEPSAGTKSSRVIGLSDDIARSMSAVSARISVIPGKNAMGIELPNKQRETIYIRDLLESNEYKNSKAQLPLIIGSDIGGDAVVYDLAKMPHLLVAGTTGSGKSVAINTMITSLLYKMTPDQCKFIMIDPKMLELSVYEGIPHLLTPVVTEPTKAITALRWVCREMEDRYRIMASLGVRNIAGYNEKLNNAIKNGTKLTRRVQTGFDIETDEPIYEEKEIETKEMPYIVVIVDEMADLMITAGKEIEASIQRIAQKARAAGIHIIMATQRPSVDVITGVIKANFPTRMSFQVVSKIDSRTILGEQGAEQLLGMGDMLFMAGGGKIIRAHGPFVSDDEVEKIVNFIKSQGFEPNYVNEVLKSDEYIDDNADNDSFDDDSYGGDKDKALFQQALAIIKRDKKCSISYIQRQLRIGYNKAANIIEEMERKGILSSPGNTGKREILIDNDDD